MQAALTMGKELRSQSSYLACMSLYVIIIGSSIGAKKAEECTNPVIQTCTNCGPAPECPPSFDSESSILQPSQCKARCEGLSTCTGAWFSYDPGSRGQCDYYNCSHVQQQYKGHTFHRKTCVNDSECLTYDIYRYENMGASCIGINSTLASLSTSSENECLENCLDTEACRSVTYKNGTCYLHNCGTSRARTGYVFWRRECQTECSNETIQRCLNCGPAAACPAAFEARTQLFPSKECEHLCDGQADCGTSYYNMFDNTCGLYNCAQVELNANSGSFRKACYSECSEYELFTLNNMAVDCAHFHTETSGTTPSICLNKCLDMTECMAVTFEGLSNTCHFYNCTDRITATDSTLFWRQCLTQCDDDHTQTCIDCEASSDCNAMDTNSFTYSSVDCTQRCTATDGCHMAVFNPLDNHCLLYECSTLQYSLGSNAFRRTCNDDCLHYNVEILTSGSFMCPKIAEDVGGVDFSYCMTRCLDMFGCRAVIYDTTTGSCLYHNCSEVEQNPSAGAGTSSVTIMRRICVTDSPRNYTQECLNCHMETTACPRYIERPQTHISTECNEMCDVISGCTSAIFDHGECYLFECSYVIESYGTLAYRRTYNQDCLQYKLIVRSAEIGTCEILKSTTEYPDKTHCLDGCLDYVDCRGVTYRRANQTCWFHSCGNSTVTSGSADMVFIERQCNPETCDPIYKQECVNCNIHSEYEEWPFEIALNVSRHSSCSARCNDNDGCGTAVYDPTNSRCHLYDYTGLRMEWGMTAYRNSCRSDCPKFKLTQLQNTIGNCSVLTTYNEIPTLDDCIHLCLDTTGCMGTTFYENEFVCTLHSCGNNTYVSSNESIIFVYLTCDVQECTKAYSQTCMNCVPGPNCQVYMRQDKDESLDYECKVKCNGSDCLALYFDMPDDKCSLLNCGQVRDKHRYHRMYRKSCSNDCPIFEIYTSSNRTGAGCTYIGDSGQDKIPSIYYCIESCLDIPNCRAVSYSSLTSMCTYHSQCTGTLAAQNHYYSRRECVSEDPPPGTLIQTCRNCGRGPDCPAPMFSAYHEYFDYSCEETCFNSIDCRALQYSTRGTVCDLYQCGQVQQAIGQTVYRRTNNTDCLEFELFTFSGFRGTCPVIDTASNTHSAEYCLELCLDIADCRGVTYRHYTCSFHNCSDYEEEDKYSTFIKRLCSEDFDVCNRTELQTCIDCSTGPTCQRPFNMTFELKPREIDTPMVGLNTDYKQIWFDASNDTAKSIYCSEVDLAVGNIVHRATCVNDCPKFEIFIYTGWSADGCGVALSTQAGGLTLHYCISKCLDMVDCRVINHNNINGSCEFYTGCTEYNRHENYTLFGRACIDEASECVPNITQTCLNCRISSICQSPFNETSSQLFIGDCYDRKLSLIDSDAVYYQKTDDQCNAYQCSLIEFAITHLVYRDSCDQDCPKYELFRKTNFVGTCSIIDASSGGINLQYCVKRCVDMTGCRGVTLYGSNITCYYHSCANTTYHNYVNSTFIERKCMNEECTRTHQQLCLNCAVDSSCQSDFAQIPEKPTWEECSEATAALLDLQYAGLITYSEKTGSCQAFNCSLILAERESIVIRKSCASDCPIYRIAYLSGYSGTCPILDSDEGGVTYQYCISKCLDMPGCRAVTFIYANSSSCLYHSCIDKEPVLSSHWFVWRICINETEESILDPVGPYTQRCLNCGSKCMVPISTETDIVRHTDCNITCPGCKSVIYNPAIESCTQLGCDQIFRQTEVSLMYRKTDNPGCLVFEVFMNFSRQPLCEAIAYDEGLNDKLYCFERCLDMPGCLSVTKDSTNCTYYGCTTTTDATSFNRYMEKVCSDDTTHILKIPTQCASPDFQVCVNCDIDSSNCQSAFLSQVAAKQSCWNRCTLDSDCETATYVNGTCSLYQCRVVTPRVDADWTLYRKRCFVDDCPTFEIHRLDNQLGVCDVIRTEAFQFNPGLCFERCLRMPGCRGMTFQELTSTCLYHSCDCSYDYVDPSGSDTVFMWRYCLSNMTASSLSPGSTLSSPPKEFPDCLSTTTSTSSTTSTPTPTALILPLGGISTGTSTVTPEPTRIYLRSCLCSRGLFGNLSVEEISDQLVQNLTIQRDSTGASKRRYTSAPDNRKSAITIGSGGVMLLAFEFSLLLMMDSTRILQAFRTLRMMYMNN